ncbi:MAG: hypothetical protein RBR35_19950 [Salinivirgaceae bacterium]|nr:hypothetical protein [Salinivirgaceae bacterium]
MNALKNKISALIVLFTVCQTSIAQSNILLNESFHREKDYLYVNGILGDLPMNIVIKKFNKLKSGKIAIKGTVFDKLSNEILPLTEISIGKMVSDTSILIKHLSFADEQGFFNITTFVNPHEYLVFTFTGYNPIIIDISDLQKRKRKSKIELGTKAD